MELAQRLDLAFAAPGKILEQAVESIEQAFGDITIRYYNVSGNSAASIMVGGIGGPGQRNFIPSMHIVVSGESALITWADPNDEDVGGIKTIDLSAEAIAKFAINILGNSESPKSFAYDLDDVEPTNDELSQIEKLGL